VKDAIVLNGPSVEVAWHGNLYIEEAIATIQATSSSASIVRGSADTRAFDQRPLDRVTQAFTALDCCDFSSEACSRNQTHPTTIDDKPLDTAGGKSKRTGREVAGKAIISLAELSAGT